MRANFGRKNQHVALATKKVGQTIVSWNNTSLDCCCSTSFDPGPWVNWSCQDWMTLSLILLKWGRIFRWKNTTLLLVPKTLDKQSYFKKYITGRLLWYVMWSRDLRTVNLWKLNPPGAEAVEIWPNYGWKINFAVGTLKHNKTTYFVKYITGLVLCYVVWPKPLCRLKCWRLNDSSTDIVEMKSIFEWKITTLLSVPKTVDRPTLFFYLFCTTHHWPVAVVCHLIQGHEWSESVKTVPL